MLHGSWLNFEFCKLEQSWKVGTYIMLVVDLLALGKKSTINSYCRCNGMLKIQSILIKHFY